MIVERKNGEILVRIPDNLKADKVQDVLDYLRYEELTSSSSASQKDVDDLVKEAKKGRWARIKAELKTK